MALYSNAALFASDRIKQNVNLKTNQIENKHIKDNKTQTFEQSKQDIA